MSAGSRASHRALIPLYVASGVLTLGEGSVSLLVPPYLSSQALGAGAIGALLSLYGIASLASRLPGGLLYRADRAWLLIAGGCLMSSAAFVLIPLTGNPFLLGLLIVVDGLGFGLATTGGLAAVIARRPPDTSAGSVMGWYTGSVAAGYAAAGFVGGVSGDAFGVERAIVVLAVIPLVAAGLLVLALRMTAPGAAPAPPAVGTARPGLLSGFTGVSSLVWLAFAVTLYINLVNGVLSTFFPIYGLAIGLTLTQIGALEGIHGATAAGVRFAAGAIFTWISYRRTLPAMVVVSAVSVAATALVTPFALLALAWAAIGLSRGLLRVASGALVMDEAGHTDAERGGASAIYLAGLDLGKVIGPIVGGGTAELVGIKWTFLAVSIAFPLVFAALAASIGRRERSRA